jgi:hypothetical protein
MVRFTNTLMEETADVSIVKARACNVGTYKPPPILIVLDGGETVTEPPVAETYGCTSYVPENDAALSFRKVAPMVRDSVTASYCERAAHENRNDWA